LRDGVEECLARQGSEGKNFVEECARVSRHQRLATRIILNINNNIIVIISNEGLKFFFLYF